MTAALLILLAGCGVAGYIACARHLERSAKPQPAPRVGCRHTETMAIGKYVWQCRRCEELFEKEPK